MTDGSKMLAALLALILGSEGGPSWPTGWAYKRALYEAALVLGFKGPLDDPRLIEWCRAYVKADAADRTRSLAHRDGWWRVAQDCRDRLDRLEKALHAQARHPAYEYQTTSGPRKAWSDEDRPPEGDGWECNTEEGDNGWERFEYHEEAYWRRLKT